MGLIGMGPYSFRFQVPGFLRGGLGRQKLGRVEGFGVLPWFRV